MTNILDFFQVFGSLALVLLAIVYAEVVFFILSLLLVSGYIYGVFWRLVKR